MKGKKKPQQTSSACDNGGDNLRFWNEERTPEAIYSVYLKKVRYRSNEFSPNGGTEENTREVSGEDQPERENGNPKQLTTRYVKKDTNGTMPSSQAHQLSWESVTVKELMAGTIEKIIESLFNTDGSLNEHQTVFILTTYRTFTNPLQFATELKLKYLSTDSKDAFGRNIKSAIKLFLLIWTEQHPEDFFALSSPRDLKDYEVGEATVQFLLQFCQVTLREKELEMRLHRFLDTFEREAFRQKSLPLFAVIEQHCDLNGHTKWSYLENVNDALIAEQLTYMDAHLFRQLLPYECMGAFWSNKSKHSKSLSAGLLADKGADLAESATHYTSLPDIKCHSVLAAVDFFNLVSFRVMDTVLHKHCYLETNGPCKTDGEKVKILVKWINVAKELRYLKNFSSLKAIISALRSNPIYRLTKIWKALSKDKIALFEDLSQLCMEENNQANQRRLLNEYEGTLISPTKQLVQPSSQSIAPSTSTTQHSQITGKSIKGAAKTRENSYLAVKRVGNTKYRRSQTDVTTVVSNGVIPYLGIFLTDLTMLHTLLPDQITYNNLGNGDSNRIPDADNDIRVQRYDKLNLVSPPPTKKLMINVDKRRKEFKILARIGNYQALLSKGYGALSPDPSFWGWFTQRCVHYEYFRNFYAIVHQIGSNGSKNNTAPLYSKNEIYHERYVTIQRFEKIANERSSQIYEGKSAPPSAASNSFLSPTNHISNKSPIQGSAMGLYQPSLLLPSNFKINNHRMYKYDLRNKDEQSPKNPNSIKFTLNINHDNGHQQNSFVVPKNNDSLVASNLNDTSSKYSNPNKSPTSKLSAGRRNSLEVRSSPAPISFESPLNITNRSRRSGGTTKDRNNSTNNANDAATCNNDNFELSLCYEYSSGYYQTPPPSSYSYYYAPNRPTASRSTPSNHHRNNYSSFLTRHFGAMFTARRSRHRSNDRSFVSCSTGGKDSPSSSKVKTLFGGLYHSLMMVEDHGEDRGTTRSETSHYYNNVSFKKAHLINGGGTNSSNCDESYCINNELTEDPIYSPYLECNRSRSPAKVGAPPIENHYQSVIDDSGVESLNNFSASSSSDKTEHDKSPVLAGGGMVPRSNLIAPDVGNIRSGLTEEQRKSMCRNEKDDGSVIIKIYLDESLNRTFATNVYKCISITVHDQVVDVLRKSLLKFGIVSGTPAQYDLSYAAKFNTSTTRSPIVSSHKSDSLTKIDTKKLEEIILAHEAKMLDAIPNLETDLTFKIKLKPK